MVNDTNCWLAMLYSDNEHIYNIFIFLYTKMALPYGLQCHTTFSICKISCLFCILY